MSVSRSSPATSSIVLPPPSASSAFIGRSRASRSHEATLDWLACAETLGRRVDLDASAHTMGAMLRRRGVPSATNLLCLALLYGPARMPLRLIAERSAALGIAHVSEPALLRRLINAADWLQHLADVLILQELDSLADPASPMAHDPMALHARRAEQNEAARSFILDFVPWPENLFTDRQVHWLLCLRWMFVTSTIKDGPSIRADTDVAPTKSLERSRHLAHLLGALVSGEL